MLGNEQDLIAEYVSPGQAKLQFWHILDHGNASLQASAGAECAGQQGAFWEMHDILFANQNQLWDGDLSVLTELAGRTGIDTAAFQVCMESGEMQEYVKAIDNQVKTRGVRVRPTFDLILNGVQVQRLQGSPPLDQWRSTLDNLQ